MGNLTLKQCGLALGAALCIAPVCVTAKPDLSGTYDVSTLTPLQRPQEFGNNPELTPEQAEKIVARHKQLEAERDRNRGEAKAPPPVGGAPPIGAPEETRESSGAGNVGGYNNFWVDNGEDVFTVDGKFRTSIIVDPPDGRIPALTAEAMQAVTGRRSLRRGNDGTAWWVALEGPGPYDGPESLGISERCILGFTGTAPTFPSLYNNFKRIVQTDDHVMIMLEMVHDARIVRMDGPHGPSDLRRWLGDSVGRWEGNTLVIDTVNFHPQSNPGYGGSENARVTEKFTKLPTGDLLYRFTVEDPSVWTAPWSGEYIWRKTDERVFEYACHEGNYSMHGILKGARLLEKEAAAVKTEAPVAAGTSSD
jgi:hypothetical protein